MSEIDLLKRTVNESNELSKRGENGRALQLLDRAIFEALLENRSTWVSVLSRHASAIATAIGDLPTARKYREQCLAVDPDNPLTLCGMAEILDQLGERDLAKRYAVKSYRLSVNRGTELDKAVVESLLHTWPDLMRGES